MIRLLPMVFLASTLAAQTPSDVATERAGYLAWLKKAPNSPLSAVAQQRIDDGVRIGAADSEIPLAGIDQHRIYPEAGGFAIEGPGFKRPIGRGQPYRIGRFALYLSGTRAGTVLTVFADGPRKDPAGFYDYDASMVFTGPLLRPESQARLRVLASDGLEADATEAGTFVVPLGGRTPLRVLRIPVAGGEESELEIFFRDSTNGTGSYPAGRFVSLIPAGDGKFKLDFNRARNPFCAYSSAYACPLPWRGNVITAPVRAGERYTGGGLANPTVQEAK